MTHYDDAIRGALSPEEARLFEELSRSRNPIQAAFATLTSENRIFAMGGWIMGFVMFAAALYAAIRFAEAATTQGMIGWASGAVVAVVALGLIKIWFFMEIQKSEILRALKRIELLLASLQSRST